MSDPTSATADAGDDAGVGDAGDEAGDEAGTNASLHSYYRQSWQKLKTGQAGVLPVVGGLAVLVLFFQLKNSLFLSNQNLANLLTQASYIIVLGFAEIWVLLLGEIDLSVGYNAGIAGALMAYMSTAPYNLSWWLAIVIGLAASATIGALIGIIVIRLRIPSFIVSLAFLLGLTGVLLKITYLNGYAGSITITNSKLLDLVNGNLSTTGGVVLVVLSVLGFSVVTVLSDRRRRRSGSEAVPIAISTAKVVGLAVSGGLLLYVCNSNRGVLAPVEGIPFAVPIFMGILVLWSFVLARTRFGRYIYAIGGNAEAARRAGVSLGWNRLWAFTLGGLTAGAAGILYTSRLGGATANIDNNLVLFAVASAVIGGVSLFGGRGKMVHALIGGVVIAVIYNGMGLIGLDAATQDIVIGFVLLAAVSVEAISRRQQAHA
jgi:D-xylose transport system permease protein